MQKVYLGSDSRKQSWKVRRRKDANDVGFVELVTAGHRGSIPRGTLGGKVDHYSLTPTPRWEGAGVRIHQLS